jgi:hypothetical protein
MVLGARQELPFIQQLEGRMAEASGRLQALLSGGLRDALKTGNVSARTYCLQAYAAVGDTAGAEEVGSLHVSLSLSLSHSLTLSLSLSLSAHLSVVMSKH